MATFMPPRPPSSSNDPVAQLCPACGLCCNGVLFADVELRQDDVPEALLSLGLTVRRKGRGDKQCFRQPCPAFQDCRCDIYSSRPVQCRAFECGQLKRVSAGVLSAEAALKTIRRARRQVDRVTSLLRQSGNYEETRPLTARYRRVMVQPIDLAQGDGEGDLRGQLMLAMRDLMHLLHAEFLQG